MIYNSQTTALLCPGKNWKNRDTQEMNLEILSKTRGGLGIKRGPVEREINGKKSNAVEYSVVTPEKEEKILTLSLSCD
jgi:hypothetical protein